MNVLCLCLPFSEKSASKSVIKQRPQPSFPGYLLPRGLRPITTPLSSSIETLALCGETLQLLTLETPRLNKEQHIPCRENQDDDSPDPAEAAAIP